jgi:hypothetical protein
MLAICSLVTRSNVSEDEQVFRMAERLVDYARECMFKRYRPSPFESKRQGVCSHLLFIYHSITGEAAREGMFFQGGVSTSAIAPCYYSLELCRK